MDIRLLDRVLSLWELHAGMYQINTDIFPATVDSLCKDFERLGVKRGMGLLLHSSVKSLGCWIVGGPAAIVLALEEVLGEAGTLVVPTHSADLSDPSGWSNPPVPESWWETIRRTMPPYHPDLTPLWKVGVIPDMVRKQDGAVRSAHPHLSFAARGAQAQQIINGHELAFSLGEGSPLARLYEMDASILLLGVGHVNNTSLHLSEARADYIGKELLKVRAPMLVNGQRQWVEFNDWNYDSDDFDKLGEEYEKDAGQVNIDIVGAAAESRLMKMRGIVDYGVEWLQKHRL